MLLAVPKLALVAKAVGPIQDPASVHFAALHGAVVHAIATANQTMRPLPEALPSVHAPDQVSGS